MKKSFLYILPILSLIIGLCSCSSNGDFENTELGFSFKHCVSNDTAPKANKGDVIFGEMKIVLNNKKTISSNYGSPDRLFVISKDPKVGSIDEFLTNLHLGDSAIMVCPADSVSKLIKGVEFRPKDKIWIYLSVSQIISTDEVMEYNREQKLREQKENEALTEFVLNKYEKSEKKSKGLFYINLREGWGAKASYGKTVSVNYTACDTSGRIIDSNIEEVAIKGGIHNTNKHYAPFEFVLGDDALISGWMQGISYMKEGGHAVLVIPSKLAYGETKYRDIEPYTPLVFDVWLLKVKD